MNNQQQSFQDRLNKLSGAPVQVAEGPANAVAQGLTRPVTPQKPVSVLPHWSENIKYPLSFVWAFLIGALAVFISRYARFHIADGAITGDSADFFMVVDGMIATGIAFALKSFLKVDGKAQSLAQTVGVVAMICLMHNLAHAAPKTFSVIFSPEWVENVVTYTEPNSILFRGVSFVIGGQNTGGGAGQPKSSSEFPTVLQMDTSTHFLN